MVKTATHSDQVGTVLLIGKFGGAVCAHYRITAIRDGIAYLERVVAKSVRDAEGFFSTVYEAA